MADKFGSCCEILKDVLQSDDVAKIISQGDERLGIVSFTLRARGQAECGEKENEGQPPRVTGGNKKSESQ